MNFLPAIQETYKISFNALTATTLSMDHRCYSYEIRSDDDDIFVAENEDASMASFRILRSHTSERIIPCQQVSVLGVSGVGLAELKTVVLDQGISDPVVIDWKSGRGQRR